MRSEWLGGFVDKPRSQVILAITIPIRNGYPITRLENVVRPRP